MPMLQPIAPDYQAPEGGGDFESVSDGSYQVEAVSIFTTDDSNRPIVIEDPFGTPWPIARANLAIVGSEDEEVPISFNLHQCALLVNAFGGDLEKLPNIPPMNNAGAISDYLTLVESLCNTGTKRPTIKAKRGWGNTNKFAGFAIKNGMYSYKIVGISPRNKETQLPEPFEGQFGKVFYLTIEILGTASGGYTPFKGSHFTPLFPYLIEVTQLPNGEVAIDWIRYKKGKNKGEYTSKATQISKFFKLSAPSLFKNEIRNPYNLLPEYFESVRLDQIPLISYIKINEHGYNVLDLDTVEVFTGIEPTDNVIYAATPPPPRNDPLPKQAEKEVADHLSILVEMIENVLCPKEAVFEKGTLNLTKKGKEVIKEYFTPLKPLLTTNVISDFTNEDVVNIFDNLAFPEMTYEEQEKVAELYDQLNSSSGAF